MRWALRLLAMPTVSTVPTDIADAISHCCYSILSAFSLPLRSLPLSCSFEILSVGRQGGRGHGE